MSTPNVELENQEISPAEESDDGDVGMFDFVFQPWLDLQALTNHNKPVFEMTVTVRDGDVESSIPICIEQETFIHTKTNDKTGAVVWDDAVVLARYLEHHQENLINGKKIVELGSGTGFVGIVAGALGANSIVTDRLDMLPLMERNCARLEKSFQSMTSRKGCAIACEQDWFKPLAPKLQMEGPFDLIIASGVVYSDEATPELLKTLQRLAQGGTIHMLIAVDFRFKCSTGKVVHLIQEALNEIVDHTWVCDKPYDDDDEAFMLPVLRTFLGKLQTQWKLSIIENDALSPLVQKESVHLFNATYIENASEQ